MFPNLTKELETGDAKVNIDSVRTDDEGEETFPDKLRNYNPTVIDFVRRCDTEAQAESIIAFLETTGELGTERAEQLRKQLKQEGIRSFGLKKGDNYYFKQGRLC